MVEAYLAKATSDGYDQVKGLFEATKGRYLLQRPADFHDRVIALATANSDSETVTAVYLDILDYTTVQDATLISAMEAMSFAECIDHVLFKQISAQMTARNMPTRHYEAVYLANTNGGLQAADLIDEIAKEGLNLPESLMFKTELMAHLTSEESPLDAYVKDKLIKSV